MTFFLLYYLTCALAVTKPGVFQIQVARPGARQ